MMRIGTCGTGTVASWISGILNETGDKNIELYACATSPGFECREFAEKFHYKKVYQSFEELMNDPVVDLVYIAVPNHLHLSLVRQALEAGKNVLCEKPLAISEKEVKEMIQMAEERNVFFMEGMWAAFLPIRQMVKKEIESGIIGEVKSGHILQLDNVMFLSRVLRLEMGGGYLLDNGPYTIGWAVDFFGTNISKITAEMRKLDSGVDAEDWIRIEYENGTFVTIHQAMDAPEGHFEQYAEIVGTEGKILFNAVANPTQCRIYDNDGKLVKALEIPPQVKNPGMPPVSGYNYEFQAARQAISEGKTECEEASAEKSLAVSHVMTEARKQCNLKFPFEEEIR